MSYCIVCHIVSYAILYCMSYYIVCHIVLYVILYRMSYCIVCHIVSYVILYHMSYCIFLSHQIALILFCFSCINDKLIVKMTDQMHASILTSRIAWLGLNRYSNISNFATTFDGFYTDLFKLNSGEKCRKLWRALYSFRQETQM